MCVHPKVKKSNSTSSDINHDCNALCKERKCRYRNGLEGFVAPDPAADNTITSTQAVLDMEDLVSMGRQHKVCPFYYTRSLLPDAELVLMPYNYLFDKDSRETTLQELNWENAIVIFDEAHNLESFATESASFDLSTTDIAMCIAELTRALMFMQMMGDGGDGTVDTENVVRLKALFLNFEDYIVNIGREGAFSGEYMMDIFTRGISITYDNYILFIDEVRKVSNLLLDAKGGGSAGSKGAPKLEHFVQCVKRVFGESTEGLCYAKARSYRVYVSPKTGSASGQHQQGNSKSKNPGRVLSYWCFAPALAMQELSKLKLRSIIVTSGTLSPLPSYSMELGLHFSNQLENDHIIKPEQVHVRVMGKGVSGKELTSSFQRRKEVEYYIELGNTLGSLAKIIPGGMLIFFPSYGVMETCLERWGGPASSSSRFNNKNVSSFFHAKNTKGRNSNNRQQYSFPFAAPSIYGNSLGGPGNPITPWKRLLGTKSVVIEPRSTADLPDAISEFHKYLGMPKSKGCIIMGVCRGKISEGIDFADNMSRAVVITGLPFPPAFDPKVKLKREYLDNAKALKNEKSGEMGGFGETGEMAGQWRHDGAPTAAAKKPVDSLSGHEWYCQQAHRAVNQAIGRVIRHRHDYGAVLLLDSRYAQPGNQQGLSKWLRPHLLKDEGAGAAIGALAKFYRQAEVRAKVQEQAATGLLLEFEEEDRPDSKKAKKPEQSADIDSAFTKVAFVRNLTRDLKQAKDSLQSTTINPGEVETSNADPGADADEPVSYIAPERVVARVDIDDMFKKDKSVHLNTSKPGLAQQNPMTRESVFDASKRGFGVHPQLQANTINSTVPPQRKVDSKQIAAQLFKLAKTQLSSAEWSSFRRLTVTLKAHGDKRDNKPYLATAQDIVALCSQREQYFGQHESGHSGTLLFLFFQLLPPYHRRTVEVRAMKGLFVRSSLGQFCKENLAPEHYKKVLSEFANFLQLCWCDNSDKGPLTKTHFLKEAQAVLSVFLAANQSVPSSIFLEMVPSRFASPAQALLSQMEAARNVERIKARDSIKKKGEETVEVFRFQRPVAAKTAPSEVSNGAEGAPPPPSSIQSSISRGQERGGTNSTNIPKQVQKQHNPAPLSNSQPNRPQLSNGRPTSYAQPSGKPAPIKVAAMNPYAKKPKAKSLSSYLAAKSKAGHDSVQQQRSLMQSTRTPAAPAGRAAPAYARTSELSKVGKPLNGSAGSSNRVVPSYAKTSELSKVGKPLNKTKDSAQYAINDPVANMLNQAESQAYVQKSSSDIAKNLKSNVPANVHCIMCDGHAKEPLLADCNHMACRPCWLEWLQRSETCPVCRKAVKKNDLSRVVFEDQPDGTIEGGRMPPTLSQLSR